VEEGLYLTRFASDVTLVHRRDSLRAARILQTALKKKRQGKALPYSVVTSIEGDKAVESVKIKSAADGGEKTYPVPGRIFIFVGIKPNSILLKNTVKTDEKGYILTNSDMHTSSHAFRLRRRVQENTAAGSGGDGRRRQAAVSAQKLCRNPQRHRLLKKCLK